MDNKNQHLSHKLFYYYRKENNAVQAYMKLCNVYVEDILKVRLCQNWFAKFWSLYFDVKDAERSRRPVKVMTTKY